MGDSHSGDSRKPHQDAAPGGPDQSDDEALNRRLEQLKAKVDAKREHLRGSEPKGRDMSGLGLAMRLGAEFVAGVIVGAGIGLVLDQVLGTSPWGLIVFLLLGFVAGLRNMVRVARSAEQKND